MVFQDPLSSLNPRRTIGESIADPLRMRGDGREPATGSGAAANGSASTRDRTTATRTSSPAASANASASPGPWRRGPKLLVCDEPVSSLDVSTQAQMIRLLASLRTEFDLTLVFVAHDLAVVRQVGDRVAVMQQGVVVELGETDSLYDNPTHPYTKSLLTAVPVLDPELARQRRLERGQLTP